MDNVQNCESYINIPLSQTYWSYLHKVNTHIISLLAKARHYADMTRLPARAGVLQEEANVTVQLYICHLYAPSTAIYSYIECGLLNRIWAALEIFPTSLHGMSCTEIWEPMCD
jgi:hypothetical protein